MKKNDRVFDWDKKGFIFTYILSYISIIIISIFVKYCTDINITLTYIIAINLIMGLFFLYDFLTSIRKIIIRDDKLTIQRPFKKYKDFIYNFSAIEVTKYTRARNKYYVIILNNKNFNKKYKIYSYEWNGYDQIRKILIKLSILTEKADEKK